MANHPNRAARHGSGANPAPDAIVAARQASGLTQTAAAALVYANLGSWQKWESGARRMHPAFWDLFQRKL